MDWAQVMLLWSGVQVYCLISSFSLLAMPREGSYAGILRRLEEWQQAETMEQEGDQYMISGLFSRRMRIAFSIMRARLSNSSSHAELAHDICYNLGCKFRRSISPRPIEKWEVALINTILPILQSEKDTPGHSSKQIYISNLRAPLHTLQNYLAEWSPRDCRNLSPEALVACQEIDRIWQEVSADSPFRWFLAKVAGSRSTYTKQLHHTPIAPVVARLREASDAIDSCECLLEIADAPGTNP